MELRLEELAAGARRRPPPGRRAAGIEVHGFTRRSGDAAGLSRSSAAPAYRHPMPASCPCLRAALNSRRSGEDVTETLDVVPRQWVRDRACAREVQLPVLRDESRSRPRHFHCDRARLCGTEPAGDDPGGKIRPITSRSIVRASSMRARGIELSVSTMADHVGACTATLMPLYETHQGSRVRGRADPWR